MKTGFLDIETSGLLSDMLDYSSFPYKLKEEAKIWVVSLTDLETMQTKTLVKEEITPDSIDDMIKDYDIIVAHNGLKFDFVALMLFGLITYKIGYLGEKDILNGRSVRIVDTLIMSRLSNPDRLGGHSLGVWGDRVGVSKTDYRGELIELGVLEKSAPKGHEFTFYHELMPEYCNQDTVTTAHTYLEILKEYKGYPESRQALQVEHKLADLAVRRETLGFWFDKDLALSNLEYLQKTMSDIQDRVNPLLPEKKLTKGETDYFTPPATQHKKDGSWSSNLRKFVEKIGATDINESQNYYIYKGNIVEVPYTLPLETHKKATIDDLDTVKGELIRLGWEPSEWKERDLTKDAKKNILPIEKRIKALEKYVAETLDGKYKEERLAIIGTNEDKLLSFLLKDIRGTRAVKVPTSPCIKVGVTKEMCPNLVKLGDEVAFAKDVADYYTYRHRKSAIAGGDIDEMDFDEDVPNTGYLAQLREDGRISTPAIELGASTNRYKHIGVANVPRASSLFGKEMRAMFGCGGDGDWIQFGFDYASLEARIEGAYVFDYEGGAELAESLLAEKPNDIHSLTGIKLGIPRDSAKSVNYAILYGASAFKFMKMLGMTRAEAEDFYKRWWDSNPALKQLKEDKDKEWMESGKKYVKSIDGRRINIRSQHSILNALFQSAGVICAKYVLVKMMQKLENLGYCIDVFKGKPQIAEMISYHDEAQLIVNKDLIKFKKFKLKEEAQEFVSKWNGSQLGAIQEGKSCYYVTLPSILSESITDSIKEVEEDFKMKVNLGYEYVTGMNWYSCH